MNTYNEKRRQQYLKYKEYNNALRNLNYTKQRRKKIFKEYEVVKTFLQAQNCHLETVLKYKGSIPILQQMQLALLSYEKKIADLDKTIQFKTTKVNILKQYKHIEE